MGALVRPSSCEGVLCCPDSGLLPVDGSESGSGLVFRRGGGCCFDLGMRIPIELC